jgi:hypothetical protein
VTSRTVLGPSEVLAKTRRRFGPDSDGERTTATKLARELAPEWLALCIWHEAGDLRGSPGWRYLGKRGVDLDALPLRIGESLRWAPRCPWGPSRTLPAIVALSTDILTGAPRSIHRIAVTVAGDKVNKRMLGPSRGCVVRLWPDDEITHGLVLGEGLEATLVAAIPIEHRGTLLQPAWAAGDARHIAEFPVLAGIEALTLLVDNDENRKGQEAAGACAPRWTTAGREVIRLTPNLVETDFADIVTKEGGP